MSQFPHQNLDPIPQSESNQPTRIAPSYNFEPGNFPKVRCHFHEDNHIKYYCKCQACNLPLCDDCLSIHKQDHRNQNIQANIVPLEFCLTEIYQNLAGSANRMTEIWQKIQDIEEYRLNRNYENKESLRTNPIQLINSAKQQVQSIVNNYFETLITYVQTKIPDLNRPVDPLPTLRELQLVWSENIKDLEILNSPNSMQKVLEYYIDNLQNRRNMLMLNDAEKVLMDLEQYRPDAKLYGIDIPQLNVDPYFLPKFLWVLERYAFILPPHPEPIFDEPPRIIEPARVLEPIRVIETPPPRIIESIPMIREPQPFREPVRFREYDDYDYGYGQDYDYDDYEEEVYTQDRDRDRNRRLKVAPVSQERKKQKSKPKSTKKITEVKTTSKTKNKDTNKSQQVYHVIEHKGFQPSVPLPNQAFQYGYSQQMIPSNGLNQQFYTTTAIPPPNQQQSVQQQQTSQQGTLQTGQQTAQLGGQTTGQQQVSQNQVQLVNQAGKNALSIKSQNLNTNPSLIMKKTTTKLNNKAYC